MMWVSSTMEGNEQDEKRLSELWKVQKWIKGKKWSPNGSF